MKIAANLVLYKASTNQIGLQEINMEDVSSFEFNENGILVKFNNSPDEIIRLRDNDGIGDGDWRGANLFITRKFLEVDLSK